MKVECDTSDHEDPGLSVDPWVKCETSNYTNPGFCLAFSRFSSQSLQSRWKTFPETLVLETVHCQKNYGKGHDGEIMRCHANYSSL